MALPACSIQHAWQVTCTLSLSLSLSLSLPLSHTHTQLSRSRACWISHSFPPITHLSSLSQSYSFMSTNNCCLLSVPFRTLISTFALFFPPIPLTLYDVQISPVTSSVPHVHFPLSPHLSLVLHSTDRVRDPTKQTDLPGGIWRRFHFHDSHRVRHGLSLQEKYASHTPEVFFTLLRPLKNPKTLNVSTPHHTW